MASGARIEVTCPEEAMVLCCSPASNLIFVCQKVRCFLGRCATQSAHDISLASANFSAAVPRATCAKNVKNFCAIRRIYFLGSLCFFWRRFIFVSSGAVSGAVRCQVGTQTCLHQQEFSHPSKSKELDLFWVTWTRMSKKG